MTFEQTGVYTSGVSVPLSGLTSVNECLATTVSEHLSFRPLIGVNFCKLKKKMMIVYLYLVSVPLSGLTSVNEGELVRYDPLNEVSVPLSGLTSVNYQL